MTDNSVFCSGLTDFFFYPGTCTCSSVGRAPAKNTVCHGFESHTGQFFFSLTALGVYIYLCLALFVSTQVLITLGPHTLQTR